LAPTSTLLFQTLSPGIFFFSSGKKEKKEKKNHREEINAEKGKSFPSIFRSALSLRLLLLPFDFCPSVSNTFS
jgi:hypothetical protein